MKLFSFLRWIGNHRSNRARAGKRASANLALEGLEDRFLPSANVISGYVFNDANNNGLFDPGESPLANSTIQLRNASNTVVGTTVTDVNGFYQFSIDNTVSTAPTTLTRTANLAITSTDWTKSLSVRQFDPTLGTLLAVDILNAGSFVSDIKVESLDNAPSTITATDSGSLTLSGPGLASLMTTDSTSKSFSASAYDGIIDFAGTSGTDFGAQTANGANSFTVTSAADLASFTGTGSISFTEVAHATSSAAGAGNLITQISTTASAQVTVVFHYIPNNSLKPGSYILMQTSQPPNLLEGLESSNGMVIANSVGSDSIPVALGNGSSTNNDFAEISPASLSGYVYYDVNDNGVRDGGDQGIAGTTITLTGSNDLGTPANLTTTTAADGSYQFSNLRPGTYSLTETQSATYLQDKNTLGSLGGTPGNDQFSGIVVAPAAAGSNYDFGELLPAGLSGYVYSDLNDNGLRDSGDQPIAGTTVTLTGSNDLGTAVNLTTTTTADGSYQLSNLRPGTYALSEIQPAGYLQGKNSLGSLGGTAGNDLFSGIIVMPAAAGSNYNFGELLPAGLSGYVYSDLNDNGLRDSGDQPIAGTTIALTGSTDLGIAVNLTTTTAADGSYQFSNLRPGTYTLSETQPAGYLQGKNNLGSLGGTAGTDLFSGIIVMPAAAGSNYNFGEVLPASLSGYVYSDLNDNGLRDSGDPPIAGTTITLTGSNDLGTAVNLTTTTAADGSYELSNLRPGTYTLSETQPAGYLQGKNNLGSLGGTAGNDVFSGIIVMPAATGSNYNFGELLPASLSGYVYSDANDNGLRDSGDQPIVGTTITLTGSTDLGTPVNLTTTTAADGSYQFTNLRPGTYTLTETQPAGYLQGQNNLGSLGGSAGNDLFSGIIVMPAATGSNYNFGNFLPASLSGYVYSDANDNGVRDSGDQPIAGTTITLAGSNDLGTAVNLTTTTAADGSYQFTNLRPGTYTITEAQPPGYFQGKDTIGSAGGVESIKDQFSSIPLTTGSSGNNYNFGEILPASIAGFVYVDANNNGVMDPGEADIANVIVTLTGTDDQANSLNQTTQTGANGSYAFGNLRPGVYAVTETPPISYDPGKIDVGSQGGTVGHNQIANIALGSGVHGTNYDFGHLQPTQEILASWFTIPNFSFGHPDLQILSKLAFLSTSPGGGTDPVVKVEATYVDGLYRAILGRPADPNGLVAFVMQLHNGLAPSQLVQDIWNSPEHRGLEVDSFYQNLLQRNADPAGRAYWVSAMLQGQSETDVEVQFLSSGEYAAAHATNADYIAALYADVLGRDATSTEIGGWAQALQNGESRSAVARAFLTSSEVFRQSLEIDYRAYLMRAPDAAGEQNWLAVLTSGQITPQAATEAFFASGEFLALAQQASEG